MRPLAPLALLALTLSACGPVEQAAACAQYVECIGARDARLDIRTDTARFEADGGCWGSEEGAHLCETSCIQGLEFLREREADLPGECS